MVTKEKVVALLDTKNPEMVKWKDSLIRRLYYAWARSESVVIRATDFHKNRNYTEPTASGGDEDP